MRIRRALSTALAVSVLTATLAGCGGDGKAGGKSGGKPADSPRGSASSDGPMDEDAFWAGVDDLVDRPAVDLDHSRLPTPPKGWSKADVEALANRARTVLTRSFAPALSGMSKEAAARLVLAEELPQTKDPFIAGTKKNVGKGNAWQFVVASRYDGTPDEVTWLKVAWQARTRQGTYQDGSKHPFLQVGLQAIGSQEAAGEDGEKHPVITRRTVYFTSFRPQDTTGVWYPSMDVVLSIASGIDVCRLSKTAVAAPEAQEPTYLADNLVNMRAQVEAKGFVVKDPPAKGPRRSLTQLCS